MNFLLLLLSVFVASQVKLNDANFKKTIQSTGVKYKVVLFTTYNKQINCIPCFQMKPEFKLMTTHAHSNDLQFYQLEFDTAKQIFNELQLKSAPILRIYYNANRFDDYDYAYGNKAEGLIRWIREKSGVVIEVPQPVDVTPYAVAFLVIATVYFLRKQLKRILTNTKFYAALTIVFILFMSSGLMFNRIRMVPFVGHSQNGPMYIAPFGQQFGFESQVVAMLYGIASISFIAVSRMVVKVKDSGKQSVLALFWMTMFLVSYSGLFYMFRLKNKGYPFKLLF